MAKVRPEDLAGEIISTLQDYVHTTIDGVKESVEEVSKECLSEIKRDSPVDTGEYKKGWRKKTTYESGTELVITVHNKTSYRLAHLLENGHAKVDGGRVEGKPHIEPAAKRAENKLLKKINTKVKA